VTEILLLKLGEMVLKGLNRSSFEQALFKDIRFRLKALGSFSVVSKQSAVFIQCDDPGQDLTEAMESMKRVFGVASVTRAVQCPVNWEDICKASLTIEALHKARTFKVEARRADKQYPKNSPQICEDLGEFILDSLPHLHVDVHHPDVILWVEIRDGFAYIHGNPVPGAGGLPMGTAGRGTLLLSGGIDSPVAGWRMARRGMALQGVHFHSYPYTSKEALDKVLELGKILKTWMGMFSVWVVPFTRIQESMRQDAPQAYYTLLMRRSMYRITEEIAARWHSGAVVTGESLGQVASQTLKALECTSNATSFPVLRPLIGMDKEEIVTTARAIGTFDTSILPFEDCCTVFTPKHPVTQPKLDLILKAELGAPWLALEAEAIEKAEKKEWEFHG
jgi:thiamine biosynthesis protein ThiI